MEPLKKEDIVRIAQAATESVFSTMLNLPTESQPTRSEAGDPAPIEGVIAMVGIAGNWTGMGQIHCSAEFACSLASALLMTEYKSVDGDVLDAVAEVANMIIGNIKTTLEEVLGPLGLGVPTVIYGRNYQARTGSVLDWTVIPFHCEGQTMEVRFCLMRTATTSRPMIGRPETALA
ncbi:MAG: chemotaxis protein CheX [Bryobacteraceae bacterium]